MLTPQPDLVASDTYNKFFTMHGIIMIFLFLVPSVPATLGNFLIPIMVGAKDLAFPKINLLSWYLYLIGGTFTCWQRWCWAASTRAGPSPRRFPPTT